MSLPSGDRGISLRWDEMAETRGWFADRAGEVVTSIVSSF